MLKMLAGLAVATGLVACAGSAFAQAYDYTLTGQFTNISGTLTGAFRYDQATNTYSNISISTTAGSGPA